MDSVKCDLNPVCSILRTLMAEIKIKEAELARKVGLPQTTINRLLLGGTHDPRAHTLKPIADFFGITIGQLCGFEPLPLNRIKGSVNHISPNSWTFIPIIDWEMVSSLSFTRKNLSPHAHKHWIGTDRLISKDSFALRSLSFMEPRFRKDSILIIDAQTEYRDGHFIVIAFDGIHPTIRKVLRDGSDTLRQSFDQAQTAKLGKQHIIYGTVVESRMDTYL